MSSPPDRRDRRPGRRYAHLRFGQPIEEAIQIVGGQSLRLKMPVVISARGRPKGAHPIVVAQQVPRDVTRAVAAMEGALSGDVSTIGDVSVTDLPPRMPITTEPSKT